MSLINTNKVNNKISTYLINISKNVKIQRRIFAEKSGKRYSQMDLAADIDSHPSTISAIENARYDNMTLLTLVNLSEAFGISVEDLLKEVPK